GPVNTIAGSPAPYFIAELSFDNMPDLQSALCSADGQAAAGDLNNFAQAGVTLIVFETKNA
ncbi:MAG TPA: EthD family reductase, partial [Bryobacteraceae bacterium]|nr:EthD family reductase [Bryobacteraceae bacterium]